MKAVSMCLTLTLLVSAGMGCKSKKEPEVIDTGMPPNDVGDYSITNCTDSPTLSFTRASDLASVYFDNDVSSLRPDAMATLARNSEVMKGKPANTYFRMEGHCDERGTQEYNLALGERRALTVRSYLISLGVDDQTMITVSFGEENPEVPGSTEAAYAKNRRVDFGFATAE
jgi:peptidoglycan-associated lipoprotein